MSRNYYPPKRITELFENEEMAATKGRPQFIEWFKSLRLEVGDHCFVPDIDGGTWWKQTQRIN